MYINKFFVAVLISLPLTACDTSTPAAPTTLAVPAAPAASAGVSGKAYTTDEFKNVLLKLDGKSPAEVAKVLGMPAARSVNTEYQVWTYSNIIVDPVTGKPTGLAAFTFTNDKLDGKAGASYSFH